jgi:hypothetical protein
MVACEVGGVHRTVAVSDRGQQKDEQQTGKGIDPTAAGPVVRDSFQVGQQVCQQTTDQGEGQGFELWDNVGHEGCHAFFGGDYLPFKTQNGPLCYAGGLRAGTANDDHWLT